MPPFVRVTLLALLCVAPGCNKKHSRQPYDPQIGILRIQLSDAPVDRVRAVHVTVAAVELLGAETDGWRTIATPAETIDLMRLVNGIRHPLTNTPVPSGHYSRIRLVLGTTPDSPAHPFANYVIDEGGAARKLHPDAGCGRSLELVRPFEVRTGEPTELLVDFDVAKSVVRPGADGAWRLAPTGRLCDPTTAALVGGRTGESGVTLSATRIGQATAEASTVSDPSGHYAIALAPGSYAITATKRGRAPQWRLVAVGIAGIGTADFRLRAVRTGTLTGRIDFADPTGNPHAAVSIRTTIASREVEVDRVNVADGGRYSVVLPTGRFRIIAESPGTAPTSAVITIHADVTHRFDFAF